MFLYFHFSLCDVWVDSKGTMLADRLTKIEDAADAFGNHVICSSKAAVAAAVAVAALFGKKIHTISFEGDAHGPGCRTSR